MGDAPRPDGVDDGTEGPRTVDVGEGRTLTYQTYGDPAGRPVCLLHGTPGSRRLGAVYAELAKEAGVRLICPDRPGYGGSTAWEVWSPRVISEVIEPVFAAEGIESSQLIAFSGGAPFALALAATRPAIVDGVSLVSSAAPPSLGVEVPAPIRVLGRLADLVPRIARGLVRLQGWLARHRPDTVVDQLATGDDELPAWFRAAIARDLHTGVGSGGRGAIAESRLAIDEWDISLADVEGPVELYHGRADENAPLAGARSIADRVSDGTLTVLPDADHLSTLHSTRHDVLESPP